ncbi:MAG: beta-propeller domain-containing protein, partial [Clostridia bacterium]|nr:beta-propeller domain-containing protein [Clostridia bacterium]
ETISSSSYLVFTTLDANTLTLKGTMALLSYTEKMYFTDDTVYTSYKKTSSENGVQTVLSALQYRGKDGLKLLGSATVNGTIHNQYSMDEYNGILRVVTSANSSADLYCISLDDYTVKAQVIGFAPKWETVRSVRFDGDYAYVCTAVQMSDPVFFFDLSDLSNITYKHTGDIPGFSHSLVDFGDGYLLGIGQNEDQYGKIEIYKESENGVEIVCNKTLVGFISNEYKAFFIDRQNKRVGFCYTEVENKSSIPFSPKYSYTYRYMLLEFNQNRLIVLIDSVLEESKEFSEKHNVRAFCDDNRIFVFDTEFFDTYAVVSPSEGESSLEFWIGDIVDDIDFSQYEINDNYHLSKVYYGKSYSSEDSSNCVLYTISQYPNSQSSKLYISNIRITDPSVKLWGLTMNSTNEKFAATMMAKGFDVKKEGGGGWYIATNDHYTVTFTKNGKYIEISIRLEQSEK